MQFVIVASRSRPTRDITLLCCRSCSVTGSCGELCLHASVDYSDNQFVVSRVNSWWCCMLPVTVRHTATPALWTSWYFVAYIKLNHVQQRCQISTSLAFLRLLKTFRQNVLNASYRPMLEIVCFNATRKPLGSTCIGQLLILAISFWKY